MVWWSEFTSCLVFGPSTSLSGTQRVEWMMLIGIALLLHREDQPVHYTCRHVDILMNCPNVLVEMRAEARSTKEAVPLPHTNSHVW